MNNHPELFYNAPEQRAAEPLIADHLTADQIDDHLIGDLAAEPAAHLAACALCTSRVADAADPLASFQHVATAWSERRSATLPIPVPAPLQPLWQRHMAWATACLSLAIGIAVVNASHQFTFQPAAPQPTESAAVQPSLPQQAAAQPIASLQAAPKAPALTETASVAPSPRATQIAADNHMLRAIDASFDPDADSPAALGLLPDSGKSTRPPTSLQD
jgi:hypothetical protein